MAIPQTMEELFNNLYTYEYGDNVVTLSEIKVDELDDRTVYHLSIQVQFGEDKPFICPVDYYVPKFIKGSVSVAGSDGVEKNRIQIYSARENSVVKVYKTGVRLGRTFYYNIENGYLSLNYDENIINSASLCKHLGLLDLIHPGIDIDKILDLTEEELEAIKEYEITPDSLVKIQLLFEEKDPLPNEINRELIEKCYTMWMDPKKYDKHTPLDFTFMDAIQGLIYEIWTTHREGIKSYTRFNIMKNEAVYSTKLQHIIDNYFNMQSQTFHDIQVPQDSNAISLATQSNKIYFFNKDRERMALYNNYFSGVLDPTKTTEGQNINVNNELTFGCKLIDGKLFLKVLDKDFNEATIPYTEYMFSPILSFSNIDYVNKKTYPDKNGNYTIAQYGKYRYVKDLSEVKYLRHMDSQISASTGIIPFVNQMAANRVMLCSHFIDQSIPVVGAKPAIVHTNTAKRLFKESSMNIDSPIDGTVVDILDDEMVKIRSKDGEDRIVSSVRYVNSKANHTTNQMSLSVKVGDKVKKGDIIFHMNSFVDGEFTTFVPLRAMFGTYEGRGFEDGLILSESGAKMMGHKQSVKLTKTLRLPTNANVYEPGGSGYAFIPYTGDRTDRYDMFGLIKPGQYLNPGDSIFKYEQTLNKGDAYAMLREAILNDPTVRHAEDFFTPYDIQNGYVRSANIYIQYDDEQNREFTNYYRNRVSDARQRIKDFSGQFPVEYEFQDTATYAVVVVEVDFVQEVVLTDKFSNLYGSKGVSTFIIPDSERPIDEWGNPIDLIIHSFSQYSRGNPSQTREAKLGLICSDGYKWAKENISGKSKKVIEFLKELYPNDADNINTKEDAEALINKYAKYEYFRVEVSPMDTIYTTERMIKLLEMIDRPMAESKMYFPKYQRWSENKSSIGVTSLMRLHFIANHKLKATGATRVSDNFVLGYGSYRDEGQKIGLQETWAWFAHGKGKELASMFESTGSDDKESKVLSNFIALGLKMEPLNNNQRYIR